MVNKNDRLLFLIDKGRFLWRKMSNLSLFLLLLLKIVNNADCIAKSQYIPIKLCFLLLLLTFSRLLKAPLPKPLRTSKNDKRTREGLDYFSNLW